MKKLVAVVSVAASVALPLAASAASVAIDSIAQRWPWNNKVDVTYTVTGDDQQTFAGNVTRIVRDGGFACGNQGSAAFTLALRGGMWYHCAV